MRVRHIIDTPTCRVKGLLFLLLFISILKRINDNGVFSKSAAVTQEASDASKAPPLTHFLV